MAEHQIKFRGGWELADADGKAVSRLTLPTFWPTGLSGTIRLTRRFGRPPTRELVESYRLEFRRVPGLISVLLNGQKLIEEVASTDLNTLLLEPLLDRNFLELLIDSTQASRIFFPEGWGLIALTIVANDGNLG